MAKTTSVDKFLIIILCAVIFVNVLMVILAGVLFSLKPSAPDAGSECVCKVIAGARKQSEDESQAASDPDVFVVAKGSEGAVATDDKRCSEAGVEVLKNSGNAVDAAVASLLCLGVVNFQSSGIGGGLVMLVAKKNTSAPEKYTVTVIDAREIAPRSAQESDYLPVNKSEKNNHSMTG